MPYRIIWEGEGFYFRYSGIAKDEDLIALSQACVEILGLKWRGTLLAIFWGAKTCRFPHLSRQN